MTDEEYLEKEKYIWKNHVPKRGQAETVRGEILRAIEKLRDEASRNGNINWDNGHEILVSYIETHLGNADCFDEKEKVSLKADLIRLREFEYPYTQDDLYDRISHLLIDWTLGQKETIPHAFNPDLDR